MEGTNNGIIHVYHGSKYEFEDFCFDNVGTEGGVTGASFGLYFTESKSEALTYGDNVYTCNINLNTPISNTELTIDINKVKSFAKYLLENSEFDLVELLGGDSNDIIDVDYYLYYFFDDCNVDTDIVKNLVDLGCPINDVMGMLRNFNITHTIDKISPDNETITHYICYDCDAISIINRQNIDDL